MIKNSCIFPVAYYVTSDWKLFTKDRIIKSTNGRQWKQKWKQCTLQKVNWYYKINLWYWWERKAILLHRLIYCSFHWLDYNDKSFDIWHYNDIATDCRLENLYTTNDKRNQNNKALAYKLLELYKQWKIKLPDWYSIDTLL